MNINGNSNDNLHIGDVRITGDLEVDGDTKIKGNLDVDGIITGSIGTARIWQNLFTMKNYNPNQSLVGAYQNFDLDGYGSKVLNNIDEEFKVGGMIKVNITGQYEVSRSGTTTNRVGIRFGFLQNYDVFTPIVLQNTTFTGVGVVFGYFNIECVYTRISATEVLLSGLVVSFYKGSTAGDLNQGNSDTPNVFSFQNPAITLPITITGFVAGGTYAISTSYVDLSTINGQMKMRASKYTIDICNPDSTILTSSAAPTTDHTTLANLTAGDAGHTQFALLSGRTGGQVLSGGTTNLHDLKLKSHTAGLDNVVIKDLNTEFKKDIDMNGNVIRNLNNIDAGGGSLSITNTGFPALSVSGGINCNDSAFIFSCPSVYAGTTNLVLGSDVGGTEFQTGAFPTRQTEMVILPNLINVNSAITNFVGNDILMGQGRIQDVERIDGGGAGSNFIDMVDPALLGGMSIKSNVGINLQETITSNRIGINTGGYQSIVGNGQSIIQNTSAGNNIFLSNTIGGNIRLENTAVGGAIELEAEAIDINYTTTNFKVRNGLSTSFIIDGTDTESLLNFKCPSINGRTPSGGLYAGTSDGTLITGTTTETSILPLSSVGGLTIPANAFVQGESFHFVCSGSFSSNNGDTATLRVKANGTSLGDIIVSLTGSSNEFFEIEIDFTIRQIGGVGIGDIVSNIDFTYSDAGATSWRGSRNVSVNNTTFDTTISNTLDVTCQFSSTSANNSIQTRQATLGQVY